jgi:hypothetical protein
MVEKNLLREEEGGEKLTDCKEASPNKNNLM